MHVAEDVGLLRVVVSPDHASAHLVMAAHFPQQMLTRELCFNLMRDAGVEVTDFSRQAVAGVADQLAAGQPMPERWLVAQSQLPVHGEDGRLDWFVDHQHAAEQTHYERSAFVLVKVGQLLGRIIPPVPAEDGRNVLGQTIPAKPGREVKLNLDESVLVDASGQLVAQCDGMLDRQGQKVRIRKLIEINEYVDFSTGNIDFDGDVLVHKGVRDCFIVKARGRVEVHGLIEAATVDCDGDLVASGGFAGREQGHAHVGGQMHAKYLDNIQAQVGGDLTVDREIVNCDIQVNGQVMASHGAIIGGKIVVAGKVEVGMLGSAAGVGTELVLGTVPRLELFLMQLKPLIDDLTARRDKLLDEQKQLNLAGKRATSMDKERQTEILFELSQVNQQWTRAQMALDALEQRIRCKRTIHVSVGRKLNAGVALTIGRQRFTMDREMRGPLQITLDQTGSVVYKQGENPPLPLAQVAQIKAA